jgi:hypothetical protein
VVFDKRCLLTEFAYRALLTRAKNFFLFQAKHMSLTCATEGYGSQGIASEENIEKIYRY